MLALDHTALGFEFHQLFMNQNCTPLDPYNLTFSSIEGEKLGGGLHTFSLINKEDKGICLP